MRTRHPCPRPPPAPPPNRPTNQREDPPPHERRADTGRPPGRRQHRPAGRHATRRRPPLRADARSATRRPLGVGRAGHAAAGRPLAAAVVRPRRRLRQATGRRGAAPSPRPRPPTARRSSPPRAASKRRTGAGVGTVVTASLLSAVLAAGGTAVVLDRTGALDRGVTQSPTGSTQQTGAQQPVTIDESSAVIDAAAKAGPAVVKITTTIGADDTSPFGGQDPGERHRLGRDLRRQRLDPDQPARRRGRDGPAGPGRAQGRPPVRRPHLRHRHAHRPRDRQGRRAGPPRRRDRHPRTGSRSASS